MKVFNEDIPSIINPKKDAELYNQERELRNKVLFRPFGLPDHAWEMKDSTATHVIYLKEEQVLGCLLLWPKNNNELQLMQMAVDDKYQGENIGTKMISFAKNYAVEHGYKYLYCHARENAIGFYQKRGFDYISGWFEEVGIKHRKMNLKL